MEPSEHKYASFWSRLLAIIIDYFLVNLVLSLIIATVIVVGFADEGADIVQRGDDLVRDLSESWGPAQLLLLAGYWLYFALMHSSAWGATVGKRVLGLYVADEDGNRLSFWQASLRYLGKLISLFTLFVGFLVALVHPRRQALHDLIAKTYVKHW
ncbi:RDD family protein [Cesiribacter sp. SM1]|uniref:RDD family protein n=1 Tax=Cesiribacter sp. SM1 TaxID=2861196 RepID=UPI001CD4DB73|nr:RDD family protein [Cesiribacter sp. SM1]